jgi:hypothetical protein
MSERYDDEEELECWPVGHVDQLREALREIVSRAMRVAETERAGMTIQILRETDLYLGDTPDE